MTADQAVPAAGQTRDAFGMRRLLRGDADWTHPHVNLLGFLLVAFQCAAILLLVHRFQLENELFQQVVTIAMAGFLLHHWLPARLRLPFFVVLSLGSVAYFFGLEHRQWLALKSLQRTATLLGAGGVLIALCHLPIRYGVRIAILIAAGSALAVFRGGWIHFGPLDAIWPVFGAMFMFRILIYAYDIEHDKKRPSLSQTLAYFFLFPALWLFVFPVIDFSSFRSTYFNDRPLVIYQKGVQWMFRGVVQLLLWRLIYHQVYIDPARVTNGTELFVYLTSNVALYLRVSGQFHFVIGLLHLFGFHLPETHRRYFLASSLTDYWRRVNIYWKDFVTKLVFYPLMVQWRTWPDSRRVFLATGVAFVATWFFHSYQWFWLRGAFPVEPKDMILWGGFGILVAFSSARELAKGRKRSIRRPAATWRDNVKLGVQTAGAFLIVLMLWSIWSCDTVAQWVDIWKLADHFTLLYGLLLLLVVAAAAIVIEGPATPWAVRAQAGQPIAASPFPWRQAMATCLIPTACLYAASSYRLKAYYPTQVADLVRSLSSSMLNKTDQEYLVRGYYENLMDGSRFNNLLNNAFNSRPPGSIRLEDTEAGMDVTDLRIMTLAPSKTVVMNGTTVRTNRWGMRDRDYPMEKAPSTLRIAILGASHEMGEGVNNEDIFETLLEDRLNRDQAGKNWRKFEILNFAVNASSPVSHVVVLEKKVLPFRPDALFYFAHAEQVGVTVRRLAEAVRKGIDPQYEFVRQVLREADVTFTTPRLKAESRLRPHWQRLAGWAFRTLVEECRKNNIHPVWIHVPGVMQSGLSDDINILMRLAEQAGFQIVRITDVYGSANRASLVVAPWDGHPNAAGHRLIADALYREMFKIEALKLGPPAVAQARP